MTKVRILLTSTAFWILGVVPVLCISLLILLYTPPRRYVGKVVNVNIWSGNAELKTKTEKGKDTLITVQPRSSRFYQEKFVEGQTLTVWTGGTLVGGIASTEPQ